MVEQLVKLLNTEFQDRIQQRTAEQIVNTSVPQALVGVFKFFLQDRVQRFEKKTVEIPQPQIIEKIDEIPEIQTAQEHSAVLAQLAPRLSGIMMKVDAGAGEDPFVKVKGLITRLIDKPYCDEETSTAAEKEDLEDDTAKHSSLRETVVPITESVNEGHPDKICDQFSDAAPDACLTCDTKYKVTCDTCAKNNMVKAA